jgi:hypothetical protein
MRLLPEGIVTASPIETRYADHLFRSRLEARWAALFDILAWQWVYEPFDGDGYVPDFLIQGDYPVLVEVKPSTTLKELSQYVARIDSGLPDWAGDVLIVGATPSMPSAYWNERNPAIGWLGEKADEFDDGRSWDEGAWRTCSICSHVAFFHSVQTYTCRPCGHYDGGNLGMPMFNLKELWGRAHEATRWTAR